MNLFWVNKLIFIISFKFSTFYFFLLFFFKKRKIKKNFRFNHWLIYIRTSLVLTYEKYALFFFFWIISFLSNFCTEQVYQ